MPFYNPRVKEGEDLDPETAGMKDTAIREWEAERGLAHNADSDDDGVADWVERYVCTARSHPESAIFGGPVRPHFEGRPPAWVLTLLPHIGQAYALRDFPDGRVHLDADHLPYGANFGTRRVIHERVSFDPALDERR